MKMKNLNTKKHSVFFYGILLLVFCSVNIYAQAPQAIPYQAVARDSSGNVLANQIISLRFSIHDSTAGGMVVYQETQNKTTSVLGLFTANIGEGVVVNGTFASIDWGSNSKFMQVELDANGGTNYIDMGTQQMLSVPFALYSTFSGVSSSRLKVFNSSGTFSIPTGVTTVIVELWGGGGGGGGGCGFSVNSPNRANGGLAGEYKKGVFTVSGDVTVTVGNGGNGGSPGGFNSNGTNGTNGGSSSFGNYLISNGGNGGLGGFISGGGGGTQGCNGLDGTSAIFIDGRGGSGGINSAGNHGNGVSSGGGGGSANCIIYSGNIGYNGGNGANGLVIIYW